MRGGSLAATVLVIARRRTRTPTRRGRGTPAARGEPRRPSPRWPRTCFWVGCAVEKLGGATMHGQLRLELLDPLAGRNQLGLLRRRQPSFQAPIDAVLTPPRVHHLIADPEIIGDIGDPPPGLDQIEDTTPELPVDTHAFPCCPPSGQ